MEKTTADSAGKLTPSRHIYVSTLPAKTNCASEMANLIRGHWGGCENRNHWVRDHLFAEDRTRSKNWKLNANLALMRMALLRLKAELFNQMPWPQIHEKAQHNPSFAYHPVINHSPK